MNVLSNVSTLESPRKHFHPNHPVSLQAEKRDNFFKHLMGIIIVILILSPLCIFCAEAIAIILLITCNAQLRSLECFLI